ncbi:MAG TPA: pentapeptide repeat-containing protein [Thermomonospora sp.]|nr:pentapeptide repeat-containing protein [Thermomonospora sp.]
MADRKHGRPAPPTESTVRSEVWDGRDLSGEEHERVAFVEVDMTEASGRGAVFAECTFRGVRFNASTHVDAAFVNCTFVRCSFFDATFTGCKLVGSMFDGCSYGLLKVSGGDWSFTGLPGADLRGSTFHNVRLREADLTGARCEKVTFRDVDLSGAWLHRADLTGCDLRGSDLSALDPRTTAVAGAMIDAYQAVMLAEAFGFTVREG